MTEVKVFGIRHHGPGSTRRLQKALREWQPDGLLVEAPYDAEKSLQQILIKGFDPPVALLMYNPSDFSEASYLPFAKFSPEWQAVRFALKKELPVLAMDLPMSIQLALQQDQQMMLEMTRPTVADQELAEIRRDPLATLARLAGYPDSERWWEKTFEHYEDDLAIFAAVNNMMRALREATETVETPETLLREAHMRKVLRKAAKTYQRIAVVCGAWHAPAIEDWQQIKSAVDNKALRGLPKIKLKSCWIPWSYERLARKSGYGAGVISPAWYELIYQRKQETNIRWMSRTARLFRKEDLDSSSAHVIEAVRLADTLAALRGLPVPGVEELEEAAITVFCKGEKAPMALIRERLVIGNKVGKVPDSLRIVPLLKDFETEVRKARLRAAYENSEALTKELDFRKSTNKRASLLLHRLNLLGIPWGEERQLSGREKGSFKERWRLKWRPDYAIRLIKANMYGNTLVEACTAYAQNEAGRMETLAPLLQLVDQVLKADLQELALALLPKLEQTAAQSRDVLQLTEAIPQLVRILRYGSTRGLDTGLVQHLLAVLLPRIFIGLPPATLHLEEEPARRIFQQILQVHQGLSLLSNPADQSAWYACLRQIGQQIEAHPLLQGLASRLLFDESQESIEATAKTMEFALSRVVEPAVKALWLEGFLHGNALLIIYQPALWQMLNDWVAGLSQSELYDSLPILRRTFARFSASERKQLLTMGREGKAAFGPAPLLLDEARSELLKPAILAILNR